MSLGLGGLSAPLTQAPNGRLHPRSTLTLLPGPAASRGPHLPLLRIADPFQACPGLPSPPPTMHRPGDVPLSLCLHINMPNTVNSKLRGEKQQPPAMPQWPRAETWSPPGHHWKQPTPCPCCRSP